MHHVYVLESTKGSWYIGYSIPLRQRLEQHTKGLVKSTRSHRPWRLIYYEAYRHKFDALGREKFLKSGSGRRFLRKQLRHYLQEQHRS